MSTEHECPNCQALTAQLAECDAERSAAELYKEQIKQTFREMTAERNALLAIFSDHEQPCTSVEQAKNIWEHVRKREQDAVAMAWNEAVTTTCLGCKSNWLIRERNGLPSEHQAPEGHWIVCRATLIRLTMRRCGIPITAQDAKAGEK